VGLAFGMRVLATPSGRRAPAPGVVSVDVDEIFARADIVTLHCPLTDTTRGLVSAARLARMKPSALLVNTSRGALVSEPDLLLALKRGTIAGAALDTLTNEPPPSDAPLLSAPHLIVTPHLAWTSLAARRRLIALTADNVRGILTGQPVHAVNL
jgi:glycerate dehydrogenase